MHDVAEANTPRISQGLVPDIVQTLRSFFDNRETRAYLVGGTVRDTILGRETGDVDIAVEDEPAQVATLLASRLGLKAHCLDQQRRFFRLSHHGNPTWIDINPISNSIYDDLARRDFTIDAMAIPLTNYGDQAIIDPHGGATDIPKREIRAISSKVFRDDPVRLFRAIRLAANLDFRLETKTRSWIKENPSMILCVSPERIRDELLKLLSATSSTKWLRELDDLGLLPVIIPEIECLRGVAQPKEHYWDVFNHCIETPGKIEQILQSPDEINTTNLGTLREWTNIDQYFARHASDGHSRLNLLKLAGLLHDISKPKTKTIEPTGRIRFFGHHTEGSKVAKGILSRLRFSRAGVDLVGTMIAHHLRPGQMAEKWKLPTDKAVYRFHRDLGDAAVDTVYLNLADYLAARGPALEEDDWAYRLQVAERILRGSPERQENKEVSRLVDGKDIMTEFNIPSGPRIGELIAIVEEAQGTGEVTTKQEAFTLVARRLKVGGNGA